MITQVLDLLTIILAFSLTVQPGTATARPAEAAEHFNRVLSRPVQAVDNAPAAEPTGGDASAAATPPTSAPTGAPSRQGGSTACPAGTAALAIHQVEPTRAQLPGGRESSLFILAGSLEGIIVQYKQRGYQFITYKDLYFGDYDPKRPCLLLSEDDGHLDFYRYGYPLVLKHGVRMTVFVNSSSANYVRAFIPWEELQEMIDSGLVDVESHGALHEDFTSASTARLRYLLEEGKAALESRLVKPRSSADEEPEPWEVHFVAYPRGLVDGRVVEEVRHAGYVGGVALQPRVNYGWYTLRRIYPR